jgi:phospholipase C
VQCNPLWPRLSFLFLLCAVAITAAGCGGGGNTAGTQGATKPTITFSANPTSVASGGLVTLTWASSNATAVNIQPAVTTESTTLATSGSTQVSPTQTTTYTATATGPGGSASASATVTVTQNAPAISSFTASPSSINAGQSATLNWTTSNATSWSIDQNVGSVSGPNGSVSVSPSATTTYTLTATGAGGSTTAQATVTVASSNALSVTLAASPTSIAPGGQTTLTWSSQNATSVTISNCAACSGLSGSQAVTLNNSTTFTATATDASNNQQTATATVTVVSSNGQLSTIKHIIFMVQENRSADNYLSQLGAYKASEGLANDYDGASPTATLPDFDGTTVQRFHYSTVCTENTSPGWNETHFFAHKKADGSWAMDNFMMQKTDSQGSTIDPRVHRTMGYYDQRDLPYYYELAAQFATSDRFFSSLLATTAPNRMYLFSATSQGHIRPDPQGHPQYDWPTIFRSLYNAGIPFRYYYQDSSVFLAEWTDWNNPTIQGRVRNISEYYSILASGTADTQLPPVVFIERASATGLDEHPDQNVQKGAADVKQIIDALMKSSAWQDSVFILTFDEGGGAYDHVPPANVPPPDNIPPNFQTGDLTTGADGKTYGFDVTGERLPLIIISPWVKKNYVSHTPMETTSILKLIETRFGLPALTARDAAAPDMTEFFDFSAPAWATPPPLPDQPTSGVCSQSLETTPSP